MLFNEKGKLRYEVWLILSPDITDASVMATGVLRMDVVIIARRWCPYVEVYRTHGALKSGYMLFVEENITSIHTI